MREVVATPYKMTSVDYVLSRHIADRVHAENKACWRNAAMGMSALSDGLHEGAMYVEGWASGFILAMHGWIELADGRIVDPTPCWCDEECEKEDRAYFPAYKYDMTTVMTHICSDGVLPIDDAMECECIAEDGREVYLFATGETYGKAAERMMRGVAPFAEATRKSELAAVAVKREDA